MIEHPHVPSPGASGPVPSWDPLQPAEAGRLSQGIVLATVGLALWLTTAVAAAADVGLGAAVVLAGSVGLGIVTRAHRAFRSLPGLVAALLVFLALLLLSTILLPDLPRQWGLVLFYVPLVPVGLDWHRVGRLQATIAAAALLVIPVSAADRSGSLAVTLGWFALAAAALWCLEQDRRRGEDRPRPLVSGTADTDPHPGDLLRTVVAAVGVGLLAALLLSVPSCNLDLDLPGNDSTGSVQLEPGEPGSGEPSSGGPGSDRPGTTAPGDGPSTAPSTGDGGTGNADGDRAPTPPSASRFSAWWLLALVALAAALAWFWWRRSRAGRPPPADREWALALVEQIDDASRARGRPRPASSTVRQHTDDLAGSVLPDPRLPAVGRLLNDALFGRTAISAHTRLWAQTVVDEILEAHPTGGRARR